VRPRRVAGLHDRVRQAVAEGEVRLVRVQDLAQRAVVSGNELLTVMNLDERW
jgi:hypothetical protein